MATLNLGRIKPVFRGAYSGSTAYVVDDIVTSGGSSYICIQAHGAGTQAVNQTAYWTQMAAGGTDVGTTITTQGDLLYRDGSGLQRLAKGTGLQQLRMNSGATAPEWATISGGAVKNVYLYQETDTYDFTNTTTKVVTSSSITPVSTNSRFIIQGQAHGGTQDDGGAPVLEVSSDDGSNYTTLHEGVAASSRTRSGGGAGFWRGDVDNSIEFQAWGIWHPNTTNACKIALTIRATNNSVKINRTHADNSSAHNGYRGILSLLVTEVDGSATSSAPSVVSV